LLNGTGKDAHKVLFFNSNETIQLLFFEFRMVDLFGMLFSFVWPPTSTSHMLGSWLRKYSVKLTNQILVGVTALVLGLVVFLTTNVSLAINSMKLL
jgi:hypothetical protein